MFLSDPQPLFLGKFPSHVPRCSSVDVVNTQLSYRDGALAAALPFGGWFCTRCLCPSALFRAAWLELWVSCWFRVPITQVRLEELEVWGWFWVFSSPLGLIPKCSCPKGCTGGSDAFGHLHESMFALQSPRGLELSYMGWGWQSLWCLAPNVAVAGKPAVGG